jgi:tRNA (cmo5U34)-methyltransferase
MSQNSLEEMSCFFNERADGYDSHMLDEMQLAEFYDEIEKCMVSGSKSIEILDLGCGTGLELERVFKLYNEVRVTAIDLSEKMLDKLKEKLKEKLSDLNIICASYFDVDFGIEAYDYIISTYSLLHFNRDKKLSLYKRLYDSLKPGGKFIYGDYTAENIEKEKFYLEENKRIRQEQGIESGFYHYDTPFAVETELDLFKKAGFKNIAIHKQWENAAILICQKEI